MGYVWGVFESVNDAVGCAGEVRCSYRLGRGEPALAKLSSYKSMLIAMSTSLLISTLLYWCSEGLTEWLTYDNTIQGMLQDLIPLVALGNVVSTSMLAVDDSDFVSSYCRKQDYERWNGLLGIDWSAGSLPPRNDGRIGMYPSHHAAHWNLPDTRIEI